MGTHYDRGLILYRLSRWSMAAEEFRAEISAVPGLVMGHAMLGMSHLQLQQYCAAETEICEAARLGPNVGYTHYALAYWTLKEKASSTLRRNRYEIARAHLAQAVSLAPFKAQNYSLLAELEAAAKQWQACLEAAERGLGASPLDERCMWYRARSLWSVFRQDEAMDVLRQTLAKNPEQAGAHRLLGWMLIKKNEFAPAFAHLEESLRIDPHDHVAHKLWRKTNVRRFPLLGRIWWSGNANIRFALIVYFYALAFLSTVHAFAVGDKILRGTKLLLCIGDVLLALGAACRIAIDRRLCNLLHEH